MEKINKNDIVVSKVDQHTETGLCFISKNYISKAEYMDDEHLWFKETISGHGAYFIKHFRPATQEECRLFEEKGPHILSNTFSEDLTGRYLKALIDRPQCTSYQKGEYACITKGNFGLVNLDRLDYSANPDQTDWWELMPEGFIPPVKNPVSSMDDILQEAIRKYPIGTKIIPLHHDGSSFQSEYKVKRIASICGEGIEASEGYIYREGNWAKIVIDSSNPCGEIYLSSSSGTSFFRQCNITDTVYSSPVQLVTNKVNNVSHQEPKILRKKTKKRKFIIV